MDKTGIDCRGLLGEPDFDVYEASVELRIFVEHRRGLGTAAIRFASEFSTVPRNVKLLETTQIFSIVQELAPGLVASPFQREERLEGGLGRDIRSANGITLIRTFPIYPDQGKTAFALLNADPPELVRMSKHLASMFGEPRYQRFSKAGFLIDTEGPLNAVTRAQISKQPLDCERDENPAPLDSDAVEVLLDQFLPIQRKDKAMISRLEAGSFMMQRFFYPTVLICYSHVNGKLMSAGFTLRLPQDYCK